MVFSNKGDQKLSGSIQHSDDRSGQVPHRVSPSEEGRSRIRFGVKNYLHHFYEDCTGLGNLDDDEGYHLKPKSSRRCKLLCRIGFSISIIFICTGILLLLLGFFIPPKHTKFSNGSIVFINQENARFNDFLMYSRWVGAFVFCLGGIVLSVCIVLLGLGKLHHKNDIVERKIFEERLQRGSNEEGAQSYRGTDEYGNLVQYGACGSTSSTTPTLSTASPVPMSLREVTTIQPSDSP